MIEKWTKGPWTVGLAIVDGDSVPAVFNSDGDEICNFGNTLLDEDAHAQIIAAAPEMYNALNACFGNCKECVDVRQLLLMTKNALKKARGEA